MNDSPDFSELGLEPALLDAVKRLGFERPSQIQAKTIPLALTGTDLVGLSETGSGKTAAFALPALQNLNLEDKRPQVIILCPTRELSVQVCEEVNRLGNTLKGLRAVPVYGGAPMERQIRALKEGAHLVVGTPGRLLDHLRRKRLRTDAVRMTVLDEADRMLDMGFREEMESILGEMPEERQTLFFSATMNSGVKKLIQHFGKEPKQIQIKGKALTVDSIDQCYYEVRNRSKVEVIARCLDIEQPRLAIIFCNTKTRVDECTEALVARGFSADRIHGDITQQARERVLNRFREGKVEVLVATDVAARGLDVKEIDVVFNYDLPQDHEDYVHRIGRTGRAGRSGRAVSFIYGRDIYVLQRIERFTRQKIQRAKIPSLEEVQGRQANKVFEQVKEKLETKAFESHEAFVDRLLDQGHTATDIAGALFTLLRENSSREGNPIDEDRDDDFQERPPKKRGKRFGGRGRGRPPRKRNFSHRGVHDSSRKGEAGREQRKAKRPKKRKGSK